MEIPVAEIDRQLEAGTSAIGMAVEKEEGKLNCRIWTTSPPAAYRHNRTGEDNGDAHLKRQVMGREVVVAITGGKLDFGPWEQVFYGEFDGRRKKRMLVKIIGE
jgi:secondary thiamine-phosphate synthase enzyme